MFGPTETMVVLPLAVLLFGARKRPELARASGRAMGEFQRRREQVEREIREATSLDPVRSETGTADGVIESPEPSTAG